MINMSHQSRKPFDVWPFRFTQFENEKFKTFKNFDDSPNIGTYLDIITTHFVITFLKICTVDGI